MNSLVSEQFFLFFSLSPVLLSKRSKRGPGETAARMYRKKSRAWSGEETADYDFLPFKLTLNQEICSLKLLMKSKVVC